MLLRSVLISVILAVIIMFHDFLNNLPNIPLAIGILAISALIGAGMVWLMGRLLSQQMLKDHNDLIGNIYQMIGVVYAVMLAFAVFIVWEQFDTTKTAVEQEANSLVSLYDMGRAMSNDAGAQLKGMWSTLRGWSRAMSGIKWRWVVPATRSGNTLVEFTRFEGEFQPVTDRDATLYDQAVQHIEALNSFRRLRLQASQRANSTADVGAADWRRSFYGGGFHAMFGANNPRLHMFLTAALAAALGFTLFIILALDTPYTGSFKITPDPFQNALTQFEINP